MTEPYRDAPDPAQRVSQAIEDTLWDIRDLPKLVMDPEMLKLLTEGIARHLGLPIEDVVVRFPNKHAFDLGDRRVFVTALGVEVVSR